MRITRSVAVALAAALIGTLASPAIAQQQLKLDQVAAALALPLIGGDAAETYLTVTNVGPEDRNLHFNAIGPDWEVTDFDCPVTASETVLISWRPEGAINWVADLPTRYELRVECNRAGEDERVVSRVFDFESGLLFIALEDEECKDGTCTTNANDLFGDFVVVQPRAGTAWSAGAIPFQGADPLAPGVDDRDYHFDNSEYAMFPATLATNFIAPGQNPEVGTVGAQLILFTLDGRANVGSQAALDIVFFDDDETPTSAHYTFDCFSIVALKDINPNFLAENLGSPAGHLYMTAIDADQDSNVHDNKFGNGNGIRVVGVHGWLVQTIAFAPGLVEPVESPICERDASTQGDGPIYCEAEAVGMWSRPLAQGMLPQDVDGSDVPTFDGL